MTSPEDDPSTNLRRAGLALVLYGVLSVLHRPVELHAGGFSNPLELGPGFVLLGVLVALAWFVLNRSRVAWVLAVLLTGMFSMASLSGLWMASERGWWDRMPHPLLAFVADFVVAVAIAAAFCLLMVRPVRRAMWRREPPVRADALARPAVLLAAALPVLLLAGWLEERKVPRRVEIHPSTWLMTPGDTLRVRAELLDRRGSPVNYPPRDLRLRWTSLDPAVEVRDSAGWYVPLVARETGRARVVLQAGALSDTLQLRVGVPADLPPRRLSALAVGSRICGWWEEERVSCWAGGLFPSVAPRPVRGAPRFGELSVGGRHACGLTAEGEAYCWGENHSGQLGDGTTNARSTPVRVAGRQRFRQLSAGESHTCAVTRTGEAYCWGSGAEGRLGRRYAPDSCGERQPCHRRPMPVEGGPRFRSVSAGSLHSCGVTEGGELFCWGANASLQLGAESRGPSPAPVRVAAAGPFVQVTAGATHSCALTGDGRALCWGEGSFGQLGSGAIQARALPRPVAGELRFRSLAAGEGFTCGLTLDARAFCWGDASRGALGIGDDRRACAPEPRPGAPTCRVPAPVEVAGGLRFRTLDAGADRVCGLTLQDETYCWGRGVRYDPRAPFTAGDADRPTPLPGL